MPTHIKTRGPSQTAALGVGLLSREADFRTLAEAIAGSIFISQGSRLHYVNHAAEIITGYTLLRTADNQLYGMKNQQEQHAPLQFAAAASSCRRGGFNERQD
jgi:PAS domain-containing protein